MPDFQIENHGSVVLFRPLNGEAQEWLHTNVESEGWQWFGSALAVDPRYAGPLAEGIQAAGMVVQ